MAAETHSNWFDGSAIAGDFACDAQLLLDWWHRESGAFLRMLPIGAILLLLAVLGWRRLGKAGSGGGRGARIFAAVGRPGLAAAGMVGVFIFMAPVLRSLPELHSCNLKLFLSLLTLCVAWGAIGLVSALGHNMVQYAKRGDVNLDLLIVDITRKLLKIAIVTAALFFIGSGVFGIDVLPLLTGAGVAGLAVAFASKETLSNFFGTMVIVGDRPFRCGDMVRIGDVYGMVESIGMRSTRVRTDEETIVLVPNSRIESSDIENVSLRGVMRYSFSVGMVYSSSAEELDLAVRVLHSIVDDFQGKDQERYKPRIFINALGESAIQIKSIMWFKTSDFKQEEVMRSEINRRIVERFAAEKLSMAFNTVTNDLACDPDHPLIVRLDKATAL